MVGYDVSTGFEILNDNRLELFTAQNVLQEDAVQYYWVVGYDVSTGFEILNDL